MKDNVIEDIENNKLINFDLKFEEARDYFGEKVAITIDEFMEIENKYKNLAFTVSNFTNADILKNIYEIVLESLEQGESINKFREKLNNMIYEKGYDELNKSRIDKIYINNIQTAYQAGHFESMTKKDVIEYRPYWEYDAVLDDNTRAKHKELDGKIFRADDEFWDMWYPPNGFNCRCTVRALSKREVESKKLKISKSEDVAITPDKYFDYNLARKDYRPDIEKLPKAIRNAYKRYRA